MSLAVEAHEAVRAALVTGASPSLQGTLANYISGRVYDKVPENTTPAYPYIVIDIDIIGDANTCSDAREVHVTIHVWSNTTRVPPGSTYAVGSIEAKTIGGLVSEILAPLDIDDALDIDGYAVSTADLDAEIYRDGGQTLLTEGVLTFTYLVDPDE